MGHYPIGPKIDPPRDYPTYTHGWNVRLRLDVDAVEATRHLERLGWSQRHQSWKRTEPKGGTRWTLRGCAWLTGKRPTRNSSTGQRCREWGVDFRSVAIQRGKDAFHLDLQGVRRSDIERFMGKVPSLRPDQWSIPYWRGYERYVALSSSDAHRISHALGGRYERGKPKTRYHRKEYLLREHTIVRPFRVRAKVAVEVVVYRIWRGATAAWKLEARLTGRTSNRKNFTENEGTHVLDDVLAELVEEHQLKPVGKPARWEPRDLDAPIESAQRTTSASLPMRVWRGPTPEEDECNTPLPLSFAGKAGGTGTSAGSHGASSVRSPTPLPPTRTMTLLSKEIASLPSGFLTEVVLDPNQCPVSFIRALGTQSNVNLMALFWTAFPDAQGAHELEAQLDFPLRDEATHLAIVVDPFILSALAPPLVDDEGDVLEEKEWRGHEVASNALAGHVRGMLDTIGKSGLSVVLVTTDARPQHAVRGWETRHFKGDFKVRSSIGDAGRFYCNNRYRADGDGFVECIKDEHNGLGPGRIVTGLYAVPLSQHKPAPVKTKPIPVTDMALDDLIDGFLDDTNEGTGPEPAQIPQPVPVEHAGCGWTPAEEEALIATLNV